MTLHNIIVNVFELNSCFTHKKLKRFQGFENKSLQHFNYQFVRPSRKSRSCISTIIPIGCLISWNIIGLLNTLDVASFFVSFTYTLNAKTKLGKRHNYGFGWLPKTNNSNRPANHSIGLVYKSLFPYKSTYRIELFMGMQVNSKEKMS